MKVVPKPEGFDLRNRRSDRTNKAYDWLAQDVLYDASTLIPPEAKTCIVIWQEENDDGATETRYRVAGHGNDVLAALAQVLHARSG